MIVDLSSISESWTRAFNALPNEVRRIGVATDIRTRLQHLQFERDRLIQAYELSLSKIRNHEKNLESALRRLGYAPVPDDATTPDAGEG